MKQKINLILTFVIMIAIAVELNAQCIVKNPSKYRGKDKKFGNTIFGTNLPFQKESEFKGISNEFTWGEFDHLEGRAYFPCLFGQVCSQLKEEVVKKGFFTTPYIGSQGWDLWIDEMKGDKVGEQLAYAGSKLEDMNTDADQMLCWVYDKTQEFDIYKVPGKSYPEGVVNPFPDVCLLKPGKYHIQLQFYVQIKGNKGGGTWSYSEGAGKWNFNPAEGYINVGISGGEFILVVK